MDTRTIDIGVAPFEDLSNFAPRTFIFRGVPCSSMEGLLQSFKFPDPVKQVQVAQLVGLKAKRKGQKKKWFIDHLLYWQGKAIDRFSDEYAALLREAFQAMYEQSDDFKHRLLETCDTPLSHSMGKKSPKYTILTEAEFVSILTELRLTQSRTLQ